MLDARIGVLQMQGSVSQAHSSQKLKKVLCEWALYNGFLHKMGVCACVLHVSSG